MPSVSTDADSSAEEVERPTTFVEWFKFGFSLLIGVTGSMIPIIGLLAAAGILKGALALLLNGGVITDTSDTYAMITSMSDSVFYFLLLFVGFTAAKRLGSDPIIVAITGGVLAYPSLVSLAKKTGETSFLGMDFNADFFGLHWAVIPLAVNEIAVTGNFPLNAIISATMVAQGGGALAIFVKTKVVKIKELAGSAPLAAFCGITEPAMYGLNLKYGRPSSLRRSVARWAACSPDCSA
ncbi:hypothetical protein [Tessaracoccus sp. OH4464_COT-324]|uniref:hypothetical protein n=1 Tax=Tessaracoccus sp. OH4464_COT-324 TaxID=2491059 RepID=UPI0018F63D38|nr:hypothetical protein [Tessaracoccus sp. OH4464_COT-324]